MELESSCDSSDDSLFEDQPANSATRSVVVSVVVAHFGIVLYVNQRRNSWPSAVTVRGMYQMTERRMQAFQKMKGGPQVNLPILSKVICPLLGLWCVSLVRDMYVMSANIIIRRCKHTLPNSFVKLVLIWLNFL